MSSTLSSFAIRAVVRAKSSKLANFVHSVIFGKHNLLMTNMLISATMGGAGDSIQQNYDLLMKSINDRNKGIAGKSSESSESNYCFTRTGHMTAAGLTTGVVTHYWYILLDRFLGQRRTAVVLAKKILIDQIFFSPVNLFVYFSTLGICERSTWRHVKEELMEKGMENIYIAEWFIWPPMQLINFALLPLRYRILFDNVISLGFDIYSPYVKYKTSLRSEIANSPESQLPVTESKNKVAKSLPHQEKMELMFLEHSDFGY